MRPRPVPVALPLLVLLALAACGSDDDDAGWRGATPHVEIAGELDGGEVDVSVDGAAAADGTRVFCKREYSVPDAEDPSTWGQAVMPEIEAIVRLTDGGLEKEYEISLGGADLGAVGSGATLTVVPAPDDGAPATGQVVLEVEWRWEDPANGFVSYEGSALSGSVELALLDGTPGADGKVIPDNTGHFGVSFDAAWQDGSLRGSFTVLCGPNEIEAE